MSRIFIGGLCLALLFMGCGDEEAADPCAGKNCDDQIGCTTDECNPATGECVNTPDDTLCDAAELCDPDEGCVAIPCEDDDECDDGDFCNGAETCDTVLGTCQTGEAPCDDGVDCTDDDCDEDSETCDNIPNDDNCASGETCDPVDGCQGGAECQDNIDCDDGLFCNGAEVCDAGICSPGTAVDCDDGVDCTADSCDESAEACQSIPDHGVCDAGEVCDPDLGCTAVSCVDNNDCDDGYFCNGAETCESDACQPGTAVVCDDSIDCTVDTCSEADEDCSFIPDDGLCGAGEVCDAQDGCVEAPCETNADCDDGVFCNGEETCDAGDCVAGTPVDCDDSVDCTVDTCDEDNQDCEHMPDHTECPAGEMCDPTDGCMAIPCENNSDCDDGLYCNGEETCDGTNCQAGAPPTCDDGVDCTDDSCDEDNDACEYLPDDGACDDGLYCNGAETCDATDDCQDGTPVVCDDGVSCTDDDCDEDNDGCTHTANDANCDDGAYCNGSETCDATDDCQAGSFPCDDLVSCTNDSCDEEVGGFTCNHVPDDSICDDGAFCTGSETCDPADDCQPGVDPCDDAVGCTDDICNETDETCDHVANDASCDDGEYCNGAETCDAVDDCQDGSDVVCDDGVACTDDSCNETNDGCDYVPNDAHCDDGVDCTDDSCDVSAGQCVSVENNDLCDDTNPCTLDFCDTSYDPPGCFSAVVNNGTSCSDDNVCNGNEVCMNGMCRAGVPLICSDDNPCTHNYCSPSAGCLIDLEPDDFPCPDGDLCNGDEVCLSGACQAGTPLDCDDDNPCTTDDCHPLNGCVMFSNSDPCDDGDDCTVLDRCVAETCAGVSMEICGDLVDNDCDGATDEDCAGDIGTYVAPWGDNDWPGTQEFPVETVGQGILNALTIQAASGGPQDVFVAGDDSHVYYEDFVMAPYVSVWGGYSADGSWVRDPTVHVTYLAPTTPQGVTFVNPAIDQDVFLDGFVIYGMSSIMPGDSSAAVNISGCSPTLSNNWIYAGDNATCFGVAVGAQADPAIIGNVIQGGACRQFSIGLFIAGASGEVYQNDIDGGMCPTTVGINLQEAGSVYITNNTIRGGTAGTIVGPITGAATVGVQIRGDSPDVNIQYNHISGGIAGGSSVLTVGVGLEECNGNPAYIANNFEIRGGVARSALSQGWAFGVLARTDCPAVITNNLAIFGGEEPSDVGVGVQCEEESYCVIEDNGFIQGSLPDHTMNSGAMGVICDSSCDSVSGNILIRGGTAPYLRGLRLESQASPDVDRNNIYAGTCTSGQNVAGMGVEVSNSEAWVTNNVIFGGECINSTGVRQMNVVDPGGQVLHVNFNGNYINGQGAPGSSGSSQSVGVFIEADGNFPPQGDYRNNIINAGYNMNRVSVAETPGGADPRAMDYNDLIGGNLAVYADEGSDFLISIGEVNALTDMITGNNILAWPDLVNEMPFGDLHLNPGSPCVDAGTSEGAPDHDMDLESRPAGQFFDIGADELH